MSAFAILLAAATAVPEVPVVEDPDGALRIGGQNGSPT